MRARARAVLRDDSGAAVVEFVLLAVLALVPMIYAVTAVMSVQSAAFAATQAVREAGRAYVQSATVREAQLRAAAAMRVALADQGISAPADALTVTCGRAPCLSPGSRVEVRVDLLVPLPLLPESLGGLPTSVPVTAVHVAPVDQYRSES